MDTSLKKSHNCGLGVWPQTIYKECFFPTLPKYMAWFEYPYSSFLSFRSAMPSSSCSHPSCVSFSRNMPDVSTHPLTSYGFFWWWSVPARFTFTAHWVSLASSWTKWLSCGWYYAGRDCGFHDDIILGFWTETGMLVNTCCVTFHCVTK